MSGSPPMGCMKNPKATIMRKQFAERRWLTLARVLASFGSSDQPWQAFLTIGKSFPLLADPAT